ncbi:MAG: metallophosphoesterase [Nitrososphaerota archaeon]
MKKFLIFFISDIHGSEECFKKFINAGKFYKANVLILGGDITGKTITPIFKEANGTFSCKFLGESLKINTDEKLEILIQKIRSIGSYPYVTTTSEWKEISEDQKRMDELFNNLMKETLRRWIKIADERLKGTEIKCYVSPGNDDSFSIDPILEESECIINPNEKIIEIDQDLEMISLGYSNITPWKCPRDITEEELSMKIEELVSNLKNVEKSIFNIHVPPYGTSIDSAPELDEEMRPKLEPGGGIRMIPVGSTAVREAILKYQPLLGLHGHIHEAKGFFKLGRTLCLNPGSEYLERILRGVLIQISNSKIKDFMFTAG